MTINTSENVYKFVKDCIKIKEKIECINKIKKDQNQKDEKNEFIKEIQNKTSNKLSKYNVDYSKFENCIKEIEAEEEEEEKENRNIEEKKKKILNNRNPCSHDHSKERQLYEKKSTEKIKASNIFNEHGKIAFNEKNYKLACLYFRKGLIQLDYSFPENKEEQDKQNDLEIKLHLNMALTYLNMSDYYNCINECSMVLNLDKNNVKAFYRKGQAYMSLDLYSKAKEEFKKVEKIEPNDKNIKKSLLELERKILIYDKKKKLLCSKMFASNKNSYDKNKKEISTNICDTHIDKNKNNFGEKDNIGNQTKNNNNYNNLNDFPKHKIIMNKNNTIEKINKDRNLNIKNISNKTTDNNSYNHKDQDYLFMLNNSKFFGKKKEFFLINDIFIYLFICFILLLLLYILTFIVIFYKHASMIILLSSLLILSFICICIYIYNKNVYINITHKKT
ncbi:peptidyl-prolyl cis-trans isomerase, putative [Plasmodium yoelii]|uniref:Peptidyl-prolyl cis-trans isomerase, putative n=1 Tax=Plasmodium yoelii TaxID=5861 RepID=A0A077Y979_PLAYE|nr:peptidyl-prolyl cis-trans isomerase, putative [Plasmodium yoelii]CDU18150.1 peptidyl-prolyl cis-trans isomerase, putative [Plasmodium yoelii]VTZ78567.1 peptidyl-prolyl cis-trans isomerase, putative [Plasmodium yoelii]|eukprot:XP_022812258.1 peptidyl-prolyl cis-trans isomerase, putative [Plasmodium yoelii]